MKQPKIAYCDYIAHLIHENILVKDNDQMKLIDEVSRVQFDFGLDGDFKSTTKTIDVLDVFGKQYRITIQEL